MSTPPAWLTPEDVGAYLDLAPSVVGADDNLALATSSVKSLVEERRSDLFDDSDPPVFVPTEHVRGGSIMLAALIYQARNAPSGFTGYGDETAMFDTLGSRRAEVMRMLGWRKPVAL